MAIRDDPVALRSPRMCRFFTGVMQRQMAGAFRAVRLLRPGLPDLPPDIPLIVYSNHPGWWDPAFFVVLHAALIPNRQAYGPMEAEALERYGFMKRIGIFGVDPGTTGGAVRFLRVAEHVLADPGRSLWMTAQGRFADPRERPLALQTGLAHLMARMSSATALPLALEYPFWTEKRPEALAALGDPVHAVAGDVDACQTALTRGLETIQDRL
ncbi:MAG: lysophospholipid acyltransferase family protein, partial [Pseudomonadota bacterium]